MVLFSLFFINMPRFGFDKYFWSVCIKIFKLNFMKDELSFRQRIAIFVENENGTHSMKSYCH